MSNHMNLLEMINFKEPDLTKIVLLLFSQAGGLCGDTTYGIIHYKGAPEEVPPTREEAPVSEQIVFNKCNVNDWDNNVDTPELSYIGKK